MNGNKSSHANIFDDLFPPPPGVVSQETRIPDLMSQKVAKRKKKARQKLRQVQQAILPTQANNSTSLSAKLRASLQDKRSARSGATLRKARTAADAAGLDYRRGDDLKDITRRLGLEGIMDSPAIQALKSDPAAGRAISQLNENDLTTALKMLQLKCQ